VVEEVVLRIERFWRNPGLLAVDGLLWWLGVFAGDDVVGGGVAVFSV
jgi:hypothetical protein